MTVAALFVDKAGLYPSMPGVDAWTVERDARGYNGPHPVVAHPPCGRWCRLAKFVESQHGYKVGDDGGCFASALESVRKWGGVLEHPAFSLAWVANGLINPPELGGWQRTMDGDWVCDVAQSAYGHAATKRTWLLYRGESPPEPALWNRPKGDFVIGSYSVATGKVVRSDKRRVKDKKVAIHTPPAFAEYLVRLARSARA